MILYLDFSLTVFQPRSRYTFLSPTLFTHEAGKSATVCCFCSLYYILFPLCYQISSDQIKILLTNLHL